MSSPSALRPPPPDTRCSWEYVAAKNVTCSVTDPGLMYSRNSRCTSPTRTPLSSSASRRIAVSGSSSGWSRRPGRGLDEHPVGVAVEVDRQAELAGQQHGAGVGVVEQDDDAVAAVVGLADLVGRRAVAVAVVELGPAQHVPVVRQHVELEVASPARCARGSRRGRRAWRRRYGAGRARRRITAWRRRRAPRPAGRGTRGRRVRPRRGAARRRAARTAARTSATPPCPRW